MKKVKDIDLVVASFIMALVGIFTLEQAYCYIIEPKGQQGLAEGLSEAFLTASVPPVYSKSLGLKVITGYSSDPAETDDTPFITASNQKVRSGIVASNDLEFGEYVLINGKSYEVQDRMNKRHQDGEMDIWFETKEEAIKFGRQLVEVYLLK